MTGYRQPATTAWLQPAQFAVAFALLFVLPQMLVMVAQQNGLWRPESPTGLKTVIGMTAWAGGGLALLVFAWRSPPAVAWRPLSIASVLRVYLPFVLGWLIVTVGYLRLMHALGCAVAPQTQMSLLAHADLATPEFWLLLLAILVVAPIGEELVFRGYLQGALLLVLPPRAALIATAALFGLMHGLAYALPVGALGLCFGWLRQRHAALWPSMFAHFVHNALTVLVTVLWPASLELMYPR